MVSELKNYQSQVHAYKFEIERIVGQIKQAKEAYFHLMRQQQMGVIPETADEGGMDNEKGMMQ